ncbi:PilX N-terminal domain-containing pilus assembly protein [Psychromonas sp.]|uniref:pilus assembly PilX family protein n=1 Tax=Psychromonas sp. TaxID=1884585 RepID=UPI003566E839
MKQTGFVLVSVLIITSITSILAFSQIKENLLQERIGGNQQKEINARLAAEQGVIDAFNAIKTGTSSSAIATTLGKSPHTNQAGSTLQNIMWNETDNTFSFVSKGISYDATAYLKTTIRITEESSSSLFNDAVAGCEAVENTGNGVIDSYDSKEGVYNASLKDGAGNVLTDAKGDVLKNKSGNANVTTLNDGADIKLTGGGKIDGSLTSKGNIEAGTSSATSITGDMTAAGNIKLKDITSSGSIYAGGNLEFEKLTATAPGMAITAGGDIKNGKNSIVTVDVTYGGENQADDYFDWGAPTSGIAQPSINLGDCDPIGIASVVESIKEQIKIKKDAGDSFGSPLSSGSEFIFTEDSVSADGAVIAGVSSSTLDALGKATWMGALDENTKVLIIEDKFDSTAKKITIDGNVTLVVTDDIVIKNSTFSFKNPETSSLTIITDGKIDIDTGTNLFSGASVNLEGNVPLTIYSSHTGADAMKITANAAIYAKLYAPLGDLSLGGGAEIMGAVRGKKVKVSSGTSIHFDEALARSKDVILEGASTQYTSVYYLYND